MQQVLADSAVSAHGEGEFSIGSGQASGPLDDAVPEGIEGLKCPSCGTFWFGSKASRGSQHLYFPRQIMGHHGT